MASPPPPPTETQKMLDIYIQDYLVKKKYNNSAEAFQREGQLPAKSTAIDVPGSFLLEWWSVFWDVFISRYKRPGPSYEDLNIKRNEQPQQQHQQLNSDQQWLQRLQLQLLLQQQGQRQYHGDNVLLQQHGTIRNNLPKQSGVGHNRHREELNLESQNDAWSEAEKKRFMQQVCGENAGAVSDLTRASILRCGMGRDLPPGLLTHNPPGSNLKFLDGKQHSLAPEDLNNSITPPLNPRASGSNLAVNTSPLNGWPLMGLDQLQLSRQNYPYQPYQLQLHQQIRTIHTGQNIDTENFGMDSPCNFVDKDSPNILPVQVGLPISSHGDACMPLQNSKHSQQQSMRLILRGPPSENSNRQPQLTDRMGATGSNLEDISSSNIYKDQQALKDQNLKKRKQPVPSGGATSISGSAKVIAPTQISAPSTPSTHTTKDNISLPVFPTVDNSSKQADLDNAVNKESLEDDVNSFFSSDNTESERKPNELLDSIQDVTFSETATIFSNGVKCCNLSLDGKVIAAGGDDKKAVVWCTESRQQKWEFEHSGTVTDLCFGPRLPRLATSSVDKTVKIWNVDDPGCLLRTFVGHSASVLSVDFHPKKDDLVCSCDDAGSIRYWSIKNGGCTGMLTVNASRVRFEPTRGRYLAASVKNGVSIIDVETMQTYKYPLKGHATDVLSVCWSSNGEYLASMSVDCIRVWKIGSWGLENCIHELSTRDKFRCCAFHPSHSCLLVTGSNESLELWHMAEKKAMNTFKQPTLYLAASKLAGLVASVSDNDLVKLWKW